MMNLEIVLPTTVLAPPAIAFQDLTMKPFVSWHVEFEARTLMAKHVYAGIFSQDENV